MVADKRNIMQKMVDSLSDTCRAYEMEINVKKTKVMIMGKRKITGCNGVYCWAVYFWNK